MDIDRFWALIDASREEAGGSPWRQVFTLRDELRRLTVEEIVSFQNHFAGLMARANRNALAGATTFLSGGCSDDGFMDFRGWLISRGRTAYENALRDPETLIDVVRDDGSDCQFEDFFYLASFVWSEKTGLGVDKTPEAFYLNPGEPEDEVVPEDLESLKRLYPKLSERWYRLEHRQPGYRPTREALAAARGKAVPDLIAPGLKVLFCGINPSLYSAAVGHHFARPGNRFWPALHAGGFTPNVFSPRQGEGLLALGYGITNVVDRATAAADELTAAEYVEGGRRLEAKVARYRPAFVAVLGVTAYRAAFGRKNAATGRQREDLAGAGLWVLPNPSGLNAHYGVAELGRLFAELHTAVDVENVS
jgi:TDG/mug DNA glycosylase family protein